MTNMEWTKKTDILLHLAKKICCYHMRTKQNKGSVKRVHEGYRSSSSSNLKRTPDDWVGSQWD